MTTQSNKKIHDMVTQFVAELSTAIETAAAETLRDKIGAVVGELPAARTSVAGAKRNYHRKRCPFPGCHDLGAPRWGQFCPKHGSELKAQGDDAFEKAKATYQGDAMKPGGVWYEEKRAPAKRGRKPKVTSAATAA